jgi:hypothetical protein
LGERIKVRGIEVRVRVRVKVEAKIYVPNGGLTCPFSFLIL